MTQSKSKEVAEAWTSASFRLNWFFVKNHDAKLQVVYGGGKNKDGKKGNGLDELFGRCNMYEFVEKVGFNPHPILTVISLFPKTGLVGLPLSAKEKFK